MTYDYVILGTLVRVDTQVSCKSVWFVNYSSINEINYIPLIQNNKSCIWTSKTDGYVYLTKNDTCISRPKYSKN